ncbi:MAG: hypothetical protein PSX37_07805 [bacterium]|nr:hypothetical protein [bacterium]
MSARESEVLVLTPGGRLDKRFDIDVTAAHGLTVDGGDNDVLWVADNGQVPLPRNDGTYLTEPSPGSVTGAVVKYSLDGEELLRLPTPPLDVYATGDYSPTHVAVDSTRAGGSGDIWVADGYGQSLVHRYAREGSYLGTISGDEGAGRFSRPHAVVVDRRRGEPELYVADRSNARLQVYDLEGTFLRVVADLISPGGFAVIGENMYVAELDARICVLDRDDQIIGTVSGSGDPSRDRPGWPNRHDAHGRIVRPDLRDGQFSTPHGIVAGPDGCLYVTEWLVGGRMIRLVPE